MANLNSSWTFQKEARFSDDKQAGLSNITITQSNAEVPDVSILIERNHVMYQLNVSKFQGFDVDDMKLKENRIRLIVPDIKHNETPNLQLHFPKFEILKVPFLQQRNETAIEIHTLKQEIKELKQAMAKMKLDANRQSDESFKQLRWLNTKGLPMPPFARFCQFECEIKEPGQDSKFSLQLLPPTDAPSHLLVTYTAERKDLTLTFQPLSPVPPLPPNTSLAFFFRLSIPNRTVTRDVLCSTAPSFNLVARNALMSKLFNGSQVAGYCKLIQNTDLDELEKLGFAKLASPGQCTIQL